MNPCLAKLTCYSMGESTYPIAGVVHKEGELYTYVLKGEDQEIKLILRVEDWEVFEFTSEERSVFPFIFRHCTEGIVRMSVGAPNASKRIHPMIGLTIDKDQLACVECKEPVPQPLLTFLMIEQFSVK